MNTDNWFDTKKAGGKSHPVHFPSIKYPEGLGKLPDFGGVYFAMQGDEILYVGQARNIRERWKKHHKRPELDALEDIRIHWERSDGRPLLDQEREWIYYCSPLLNRKVTSLIKMSPSLPAIAASLLVLVSSVSMCLITFLLATGQFTSILLPTLMGTGLMSLSMLLGFKIMYERGEHGS